MEEEDLIAMQFTPDPYENQDKRELVLKGEFILNEIHVPNDQIEETMGLFCKIDFTPHQQDPSQYPFYNDLVGASEHCLNHPVEFKLTDIAQEARDYDSVSSNGMHSPAPKGFIFHQPHAGASLLANTIMAASPETTRVVSPHRVITRIFNIHEDPHNSSQEQQQIQAFRDAVYMFGRSSTSTMKNFYIREEPSTTTHLSSVRQAFPDSKWVFLYRDPNVVLSKTIEASHERRACGFKNRRNPLKGLQGYVQSKSSKNVVDLTDEQVCSAWLGLLLSSAQQEYERDAVSGRLVNYDNEMNSEDGVMAVLEFLGVSTTEQEGAMERINEQRQKKANGNSFEGPTAWDTVGSSTEEKFSEEVVNANAEYVQADMTEFKL
uniref:Sulfotransferase domain-containing protein n=1 Tax=Asterionellopsis glacialis TaxID=33640 RepID=A0A7S0PXD8_9STRA